MDVGEGGVVRLMRDGMWGGMDGGGGGKVLVRDVWRACPVLVVRDVLV